MMNFNKTSLDGLILDRSWLCRNLSGLRQMTEDKARHEKMVSLVERMLELHKSPTARTPGDKERVKREIESTDWQIDHLVYELYGLSPEEIAIVEGKE